MASGVASTKMGRQHATGQAKSGNTGVVRAFSAFFFEEVMGVMTMKVPRHETEKWSHPLTCAFASLAQVSCNSPEGGRASHMTHTPCPAASLLQRAMKAGMLSSPLKMFMALRVWMQFSGWWNFCN